MPAIGYDRTHIEPGAIDLTFKRGKEIMNKDIKRFLEKTARIDLEEIRYCGVVSPLKEGSEKNGNIHIRRVLIEPMSESEFERAYDRAYYRSHENSAYFASKIQKIKKDETITGFGGLCRPIASSILVTFRDSVPLKGRYGSLKNYLRESRADYFIIEAKIV